MLAKRFDPSAGGLYFADSFRAWELTAGSFGGLSAVFEGRKGVGNTGLPPRDNVGPWCCRAGLLRRVSLAQTV
jgi:hypothetical protein